MDASTAPGAGILDRILEVKRDEVAAAKRTRPQIELRRAAEAAPLPRDFLGALRARIGSGRAAVIAEIRVAAELHDAALGLL